MRISCKRTCSCPHQPTFRSVLKGRFAPAASLEENLRPAHQEGPSNQGDEYIHNAHEVLVACIRGGCCRLTKCASAAGDHARARTNLRSASSSRDAAPGAELGTGSAR